MITGSQIQRHRNYSTLMKEHERSKRFKQAVRLFLYSLFTTIFIVLLVILSYYVVTHLQKKQDKGNEPVKTALMRN